MNILCIGDIVGKPGRNAVVSLVQQMKDEYSLDCVIANAENVAGGSGLTSRLAKHLFNAGCDVLTLGDHVWDQKELELYLQTERRVIRPANVPEECPGSGYCIIDIGDKKVGVINLLGRVFMRHHSDCPFKKIDSIIEEIKKETNIIIVDFHAEATSEKVAMGHFVNGKVSAVVGTHTHIQTADEKILSEGTAYITDLGMTGPYDSVIGQDKDRIIKRFLTAMPVRFNVAENEVMLSGVIISIDENTGKAEKIIRVQKEFHEDIVNKKSEK